MHIVLTILLFNFSYSESTDNLNISKETIFTSYYDDGMPHIGDIYEIDKSTGNKKLTSRVEYSYYDDGTLHIVDNYEIDKSTGNKKLTSRIEYFQDGTCDLIRFIDGGIYSITNLKYDLESKFLSKFFDDGTDSTEYEDFISKKYFFTTGDLWYEDIIIDELHYTRNMYHLNGNIYMEGLMKKEDSSMSSHDNARPLLVTAYYKNGNKYLYMSSYKVRRYIDCWEIDGKQILKNGNGLYLEIEGGDLTSGNITHKSYYEVKDSLKNGKYEYLENDIKRIDGQYLENKEYGTWTYYNEDGSVEKQINY